MLFPQHFYKEGLLLWVSVCINVRRSLHIFFSHHFHKDRRLLWLFVSINLSVVKVNLPIIRGG